MKRFRKSSAIAAFQTSLTPSPVTPLYQIIVDNFDCAMTHAMAMITIGPSVHEEANYDETIPRVKKRGYE